MEIEAEAEREMPLELGRALDGCDLPYQLCRKPERLAGPVPQSGVGNLILFADGGQRRAGNTELRGDFVERPVADPFIKLKTCADNVPHRLSPIYQRFRQC